MNRWLAVAVLAVAVGANARADDAARAAVEKAIKAQGYEKDPIDLKMSWKDTGTLSFAGMKINYVADWTFAGPDKYHFRMTADFGGMKIDVIAVVNGKSGFESMNGMVRDLEGEKLDYTLGETYQLYATCLVPLLKDKAFQLTSLPDAEVAGKKAVVVRVKREGRPNLELSFDKETGLLLKSKMRNKDEFQNWKEVDDEAFYSDWKDAGNRKVFTRMKVLRDGNPMIETVLSEQRILDTVDDKLFVKPAK